MKICISACEHSADLIGSLFVKALKTVNPNLTFTGIGGPRLQKEGVKLINDITHTSSVGVTEAITFLPETLKNIKKLINHLNQEKPDCFIPIDAQGFHMAILKKIKTPAYYLIPPTQWQWGTKKGGLNVVKQIQACLCVYPEERLFYEQLGTQVIPIKHPLLEMIKNKKITTTKRASTQSNKKTITIFPGSRYHEIKRCLPIFLKAAETIEKEAPTPLHFVVSIVNPKTKKFIQNQVKKAKTTHITSTNKHSHDLIKTSHLSLINSGTIALEHALYETPCIAAYRFSWATYIIGKTIFAKRIKRIKFMTLPNLIAKKQIIPEYLQHQCTAKNIAKKALELLNKNEDYQSIIKEFKIIQKTLNNGLNLNESAKRLLSLL